MRRFAIKDIGVLDRINKINRIMGRGSLILVSFLALAGAGCVYTDDSPDTNNVNEARDVPILALTPCTNSTGAAFMGFDFDSKIDWNSRTNCIMDSCEDGLFLSRELELKQPFHGFETVEVRGDIDSRKAYAMVFDRMVVCEFDICGAQRWTDEVRRDFAESCGIDLVVESASDSWVMLKGETDALRIWVCAGAYSVSSFCGDQVETESGVEYQLDVRRSVQ